MDLWLPEDARREQQIESSLRSQVWSAKRLERELKELDPYLEVVFVGERAEDPQLRPGRWHVRRRNPGFIDHYWALEGPEGEYREPGEWVVNELKARDLWNERISEYIRKQDAMEQDRKLREAALEKEQLKDETAATFRAAKRVAGEGGMSKRKWGRGGVKGVVGHGAK